MENEISRLRDACQSSLARLEDVVTDSYSLAFERFDAKAWRTQINDMAKAIEYTGGILATPTMAARHPEFVLKLADIVCALVDRMAQYPATRGIHLLRIMCDHARQTIKGVLTLCELVAARTVFVEAYQWSFAGRMREAPASAVEHVCGMWDVWAQQVREAVDMVTRLLTGESVEGPVLLSDDEARPRAPEYSLTSDEYGMAQDCEAFGKLVRTFMRKIRLRCLNTLLATSPEDFYVVDELYACGQEVAVQMDELAAALVPPQNSHAVEEAVRRLAKVLHSLVDVVRARVEEQHVVWFESWAKQVDRVSMPIIERNPIR